MYPVELIYHNCSEGPCFAISPSANHLIVRDSVPIIARPGVQTTVLDHASTDGIYEPHRMAQVYRTARTSNAQVASTQARDGLFLGNLQHYSRMQAGNQWGTQDPQPQAWTAPDPSTGLLQDRPGSGPFVFTPEENKSGPVGLPVLGARGM